jgi:hypothetical protein
MLDGFLVSLYRPALWLLVAPSKRVHQSPNVVRMVFHSEFGLYYFGEASRRP